MWVNLLYRDGYDSYEQSRATSGRVSPSDLPDSPCQSPPPKGGHQHPRVPTLPIQRPYHQQQPSAVSRPQQSRATAPNAEQNQSNALASDTTIGCFPHAAITLMQPSSATVENGRKEKVETEEESASAGVVDEGATPACFSSRTSISRLTFSDDEDKIELKEDKLNTNESTSFSADAVFKPTKVSVIVLA